MMVMASCTKTITVDLPQPEAEIVVEGYVENGRPPYVLLTKNSAYFGGIDVNDLSSYFVHGAQMKVWDGNDTVPLVEFCFGALSDSLQRVLAHNFGFDVSDTGSVPNICVYTVPNALSYYSGDTLGVFLGHVNHSYGLRVDVDGKTLTSQTYIPGLVPITMSYENHSNDPSDSLVNLFITFDEPDTPGNFVRYFTQQNSNQMYSGMPSAFDDELFSGKNFTFPIQRSQSPYADIDIDTYGYFFKGDTVKIKWAQIDSKSYAFWNSIDNDGGDSPFSAPVKIKTNINGGLGVWCGYGAVYDQLVIPR